MTDLLMPPSTADGTDIVVGRLLAAFSRMYDEALVRPTIFVVESQATKDAIVAEGLACADSIHVMPRMARSSAWSHCAVRDPL